LTAWFAVSERAAKHSDPTSEKEGGVALSIDLAARQFATPARYVALRRFSEAPCSRWVTLGLLNFIESMVGHAIFRDRLDQAEVSL
jgi:hypothetical protein